MAGVAKIIPPREWLEEKNQQNYEGIEDMVIGTPIEQKITPLGTKSGGRYETRNTAKTSMTVKDFRKMTEEERHGLKYCGAIPKTAFLIMLHFINDILDEYVLLTRNLCW